jgi:hypothetical protein
MNSRSDQTRPNQNKKRNTNTKKKRKGREESWNMLHIPTKAIDRAEPGAMKDRQRESGTATAPEPR